MIDDRINELTDDAIAIVSEALESPDPYTKLSSAIQFLQTILIVTHSERLKAQDRWDNTIVIKKEKQ